MQAQDRLRGLYAITDERLMPLGQFFDAAEKAVRGGARILQYRDKNSDPDLRLLQARQLRALCDHYDRLLIINDDIELAAACEADGVHLGREDASIAQARERLGSEAIIGISCYDQLALAIEAQEAGADYVAFGAMYASKTKPDAALAGPGIVQQAKQQLRLPVCAIGGITADNIGELVAAGADMAAVISDLFDSDMITARARQLAGAFDT